MTDKYQPQMNFLKNLKPVLFVVAAILILVVLRTTGHSRFKPDAARWAEPSFSGSNLIQSEKLADLSGEKLFIAISGYNPVNEADIVVTEPGSILQGDTFRLIREHEGPVILMSPSVSTSARLWMVISQMGIENLYILSDTAENEIFKYKFRPDTTAGPEL